MLNLRVVLCVGRCTQMSILVSCLIFIRRLEVVDPLPVFVTHSADNPGPGHAIEFKIVKNATVDDLKPTVLTFHETEFVLE